MTQAARVSNGLARETASDSINFFIRALYYQRASGRNLGLDIVTKSTVRSTWGSALSDFRDLTAPRTRVRARGTAFNGARTTELLWRRYGLARGFDRTSPLKLDVLIPVASTDTSVLPLTVEGLRRNLAHPLGKIIVVTQADSDAHRLAAELGCEVIDEETVVPVRRADIDYRVEPWDRSGWLLAQLLKLSAEIVSTEDHVLVIDADTVLIRPQTFTYRGAVVALVSGEYHPPYFEAYRALLDEKPLSRVSFIAHQTVMSRRTLADLKALIERRRSRPWWQAILDVCDFSELSCFADYELYGNYAFSRNPSIIRRWWANCPLPRDRMSSLDDLHREFGSRYRTLSFHHYI